MEVGCLRHPGASTIGSQLQDEDCSHVWQILEKRAMRPYVEREADTWSHWIVSGKSEKRQGEC